MADKKSQRSQDSRDSTRKSTYRLPTRARNPTGWVGGAAAVSVRSALVAGLPVLLMLAVLVWMGRQASRSQSGMFGFGRNRARRYTEDRPRVTFADVAGADEAKQDLREVADFLSHPSKYLAIGARIPRGVAWLIPAADPVRRVTIVPHGRALGSPSSCPWKRATT